MPIKIEHKIIDGVELKRCSRCKEWQTPNCFNKNKSMRDGLQNNCKSCTRNYDKQNYIDNTKQRKKQHKKWFKNNPNYNKQRYNDNIEKIKKSNKEYRINHPNYDKQYRKNNRNKHNAFETKRRAIKLNQTSLDANLKKIEFLYIIYAETNTILGEPYFHVDHIQPLSKGGLHHEDNLQILEAPLNLEKHAKWSLSIEEKNRYKGFRIKG